MLPVKTQKSIYFHFIVGSTFSSVFGFGVVEMGTMVADSMLLLQECDCVWKYENRVKTEEKEPLLFTLCSDWI